MVYMVVKNGGFILNRFVRSTDEAFKQTNHTLTHIHKHTHTHTNIQTHTKTHIHTREWSVELTYGVTAN